MKHFFRKIGLIALICILGLCILTGCDKGNDDADGGTSNTPSKGLEYELSDDETYYIVVGIGTCTDADVVIPDTYEEKPVKGIGVSAFENCERIESIAIPSSISFIENAFSFCTNLASVYITDIVAWCQIDFIPLKIGNATILDMNPLGYAENLYVDNTLVTNLVIPDGVISISDYAFIGCDLTSVTLPSSVTSIGDSAFSRCSNLKSVKFGENSQLTSIGNRAFDECSSLTSVTFGDNSQLTSIGDWTFKYCSSLESITIPASVTSIGDWAFSDCISLIQTENGVSYVDKWVVDCDTSVATVSLRENTVGIANGAFSSCSSLKRVTFGDNSQLTSIGSSAFSSCSSLTRVTFGDNSQLTSIGSSAFYDCSSLERITIPNSVTSIGVNAFWYCSSLTSITIPSNVTYIGPEAFGECHRLTSVTLENTSGWKAGSTAISSYDLESTYIAATYLKSTYTDCAWTRSDD